MPTELAFHVASKAVVVDPATNTALILRLNEAERTRKGQDEWHLPGGVRDDPAEALPDTARREIREETGLGDVALIGLVDYGEWDGYYQGAPSHFLALIFEFEVRGGIAQAKTSDEHSEHAWVSLDELDIYPAL